MFVMSTTHVTRSKENSFIGALLILCCLLLGCQHSQTVSIPPQKRVFDAIEKIKTASAEEAAAQIGKWRLECRKGRALYCYRLGRLFQLGIHLNENRHESFLLFQRGCENKHKTSCLLAGQLALDSSHSFYAPATAIASFARGCQLKEARACYEGGVFWLLGEGEQENFNKAATYFGLSCRGEFGPACANLGIMAQYGIGIEPSRNSARLLFEKGCSFLDPLSCFLAAGAFQNTDTADAKKKAIEYSDLSCLGDDARGCVLRGDLARQQKQTVIALDYYHRACDLNNGIGCYRAGLISKVPIFYFEKACRKNVPEGCVAQGLHEMRQPEFSLPKIAVLFENACSQKQAIGCFQLSRLYQENPELIPGPASLKKAQKAACLGGVRQACVQN